MRRPAALLCVCFCAGIVAALATLAGEWLWLRTGFPGLGNWALQPMPIANQTCARLLWGGVWGLLFYFGVGSERRRRHWMRKGLLFSLVPALFQLLVLLPPFIASVQAVGLPSNNPTGYTQGDFTLTLNDPPACTVGFLPPSSWRSPADLSDVDTPDGLYCKLPQDSPIAVRGARIYPCMGQPGKRAPTVEICESDKPFEPLAMRQHVLGPYPVDPNLLAQGIPPDDRITFQENIFGPLEGTPLPPGPAPKKT